MVGFSTAYVMMAVVALFGVIVLPRAEAARRIDSISQP
jgi:hypothetical protein